MLTIRTQKTSSPQLLSAISFPDDWQMLFSKLKNHILLLTQAQSPLGYMLVKEFVLRGIHTVVTVPEQPMISGWWKEILRQDPHCTSIEENTTRPETIIQRLLWKYGQLHVVWLHAEYVDISKLSGYWKNWIQALRGILKSNSCIVFSTAIQADSITCASPKRWLPAATHELEKTMEWVEKSLHPAIRFTGIPPFLYRCQLQAPTEGQPTIFFPPATAMEGNPIPMAEALGS